MSDQPVLFGGHPPEPAAVKRELAKQPVPWHWRRYMHEGGVGWLLGKRGNYKTGFALHLAVATILPDFKPFGAFSEPVTKSGPVLYMDAENGRLLYPRIQRAINGFGLSARDAERVWSELYVYDRTLNIFTGRYVEDLIRFASELKPSLVIFDTFMRFAVGMGYTDADTSKAIERMAEIQKATGATQLWLHHPSKNPEAPDPFRGAGGFLDAADFAYKLEKKGKRALLLTTQKQRAGEEPDPVMFDVEEDAPVDGAEIEAQLEGGGVLTIRQQPKVKIVGASRQDTTPERLRDDLLAAVWANPGLSKRALEGAVKGKAETVRAGIDELVAEGVIVQKRDGAAFSFWPASQGGSGAVEGSP